MNLLKLQNASDPKPLTRVDVSRKSVRDPGVLWLLSAGFRFKHTGSKVFLERVAWAVK